MASIDIILATYNSEKFLDEQLTSLLNQTYTDWRLLIRDGGSTDSTLVKIRQFCSLHPDKVKILSSRGHSGYLENFTKLLEASDAEIILFCDHDDVWMPEKVEKTVQRIRALESQYSVQTPVLVHCDAEIVDSNLRVQSGHLHARWKFGTTPKQSGNPMDIPVFGCMMGINLALRNLALPIPSNAGGHDTWIGRIAWYLGVVDFIDEPLIKYRVHQSNATCGNLNKYPQVLLRWIPCLRTLHDRLIAQMVIPTRLFTERFGDQLTDKQRRRLNYFGHLDQFNRLSRLWGMLRFHLYANGFLRTVGLWLFI